MLNTLRAYDFTDQDLLEMYGYVENQEDSDTVDAAWRLYRQFLSIPGLTYDNKVSMVEDAANHGRISPEDAQMLMGYLGVL